MAGRNARRGWRRQSTENPQTCESTKPEYTLFKLYRMLRASANLPLDCRHRCFVLASKNWKRAVMFQSVNDVIAGFGAQKYVCNNNVATVVYLGTALQKPILVEEPAGVAKT